MTAPSEEVVNGGDADRGTPRSRGEIERRVRELGDWFHNLDLHGVQTAPSHFLGDYPAVKWQRFAHAIPQDLHGWTVLDIGCNAGFYSQEMKRRGADRVRPHGTAADAGVRHPAAGRVRGRPLDGAVRPRIDRRPPPRRETAVTIRGES